MSSGMDYVIIRPTGFFSDMFMILDMARRGRVYLLGSGAGKINPIHSRDFRSPGRHGRPFVIFLS
jgi:uncharacterized protein YbjT (DUF2867 family)